MKNVQANSLITNLIFKVEVGESFTFVKFLASDDTLTLLSLLEMKGFVVELDYNLYMKKSDFSYKDIFNV